MKKKKRVSKTPKKEKDILHRNVILLDDILKDITRNVFFAMDVLCDDAFHEKRSSKKTK